MSLSLHARRQRGFSLVELMVAMGLSLLLLAGALSILYSSKLTYAENDRLARLQEAGRTTIELMLRDARAAGYQGCSRPLDPSQFSNGLQSPTDLRWNFTQPVFGFEANAGAWSPALNAIVTNATVGSDVLVLRTTRQGQQVYRTNAPASGAADVSVDREDNAAMPPANTPMVIADCEGASVFMANSYTTPTTATATIGHGVAANPGNADASLTRGFVVGALVMPIHTVIYYVRPSGSGNGPALWQMVASANGALGNPQELVEGVENLQVRYGVDTTNDLLADAYLTAAQVDLANQWDRVISIELAVLVRSPTESGVERDTRTYQLLDTNVGPFNDRRQRAVFTTTVVLRNRTS